VRRLLVSMSVLLLAAAVSASPSVALAAEDGPATLAVAITARDTAAARALLEAGADPEGPPVNGFSPLMRAAIRDDAGMVERRLSTGRRSTPGTTPG
jgi:ankyrin repeat protein